MVEPDYESNIFTDTFLAGKVPWRTYSFIHAFVMKEEGKQPVLCTSDTINMAVGGPCKRLRGFMTLHQ